MRTEEAPEGRRLSGKVLTSGADWLLFDPDGVGHLDVRVTLETQDGAHIYVQYFGVIVMNEKVNAAFEQGGSTDYGDTYFMTQPRFETGDSRYKWLNCVCKQHMDLLDQPCKLTDDQRTCNTFGTIAPVLLDAGLGREVTKEKMLELLQKYEDKGFVLQPENAQNPSYFCACCGCCCSVLQMMKKFPN